MFTSPGTGYGKPYWIVILLMFCPLMSGLISAETDEMKDDGILQVSPHKSAYGLASWMDVLEDQRGELSVSDVMGKDLEARFRPNGTDALNFGVTTSVLWLRFRIRSHPADSDARKQERVLGLGEGFAGRVKWSLFDQSGALIGSGGSNTAKDSFARIETLPQIQTFYLRV